MIFFVAHTHLDDEEEAEEEETEAGIDDELLGELDDDAIEEGDELVDVIDPLLPLAERGLEDPEIEGDIKEDGGYLDDDDEEVDDYDSFDDRDEM